MTKELAPRKKLVSKAIADNHPHLLAALEDEQSRLLALVERRRKVLTIEGTSAILRISDAMLPLRAGEIRRGVLDFEDLVVRTESACPARIALWVQSEPDQGLDHHPVDEAQDTSPRHGR